MLEPEWSSDPVLPNSLVDLLDTGDREDEEEEEEKVENEIDLTISEKAMMNFFLTIIILQPMRGWGTAAEKR